MDHFAVHFFRSALSEFPDALLQCCLDSARRLTAAMLRIIQDIVMPPASRRMPAVFIGHGSPMNALEDNRYTAAWQTIASALPRPRAILVISAHWTTRGTAITSNPAPETIHDFRGFPQALFDVRYPAPGDPVLAASIRDQLAPFPIRLDDSWGLDHGAWSVLVKMYPQADIPVLQLSLDTTQGADFHYAAGQALAVLREQGILLLGTGNVVHNLEKLVWGGAAAPEWATAFNQRVRDALTGPLPQTLTSYADWGESAAVSVPSAEHFLPILTIAGCRQDGESITIAVDGIELGAISMLSAVVGG